MLEEVESGSTEEKQKTLYLRITVYTYMRGRVSTSETPFHMHMFTVYGKWKSAAAHLTQSK